MSLSYCTGYASLDLRAASAAVTYLVLSALSVLRRCHKLDCEDGSAGNAIAKKA